MKFLVINLGLKSVRAILFDGKGRILSSHHERVHTLVSKDHVEQDPQEWWDKCISCIKKACKGKIDYITVTASSACVVPVDLLGNPVSNAIMVSDKRAWRESKYIENLREFQKTGYRADPYYSIPKILWIKNNSNEIYKKTHKFLSPNDFFIKKMTGDFVIDEISATKYYTIGGQYPRQLLKKIGIEEEKLPKIVKVGCVLETSDDFKAETGIRSKVIVTTYDAISSFFGAGIESEGDASDMSGTVTSLRVLTKKSLKKREGRIFSVPYGNYNIIGASNNLGGGLIEWTLDVFYPKEKHLVLENLSDSFSAKTGLIFLPYLLGERAPLWDSSVRGSFLGIERFHGKSDKARAVLESTGFILKGLIDAIEENGIDVKRLFVSGGLAKLDIINQIKADITGMRIYKIKETESTALGAFCLAMKSIDGDFKIDTSKHIEKIYEPDSEKHKVYMRGYRLFNKAYVSLKDFYDERKNELESTGLKKVNL